MKLPRRLASSQRATVRSGEEEGSLLVEALVGIGLLGLVTAAVATLLPAALEAEARSRAHRAALTVGDALLEVGVAGLPGTTLPLQEPIDGVRIMSARSDGEDDEAQLVPFASECGGPAHDPQRVTAVDVEHGARTAGREVALRSGPRSAVAAPDARNHLFVRLPGVGDLEDLVVLDPNGDVAVVEPSGNDCMAFRDLPRGTSWITAVEGPAVMIDRLHVPLAQRPLPVTLADRPHARTVDVAPAGWLRVDVDDRGARPPDHVASGSLRWFVRGDDAKIGLESGQSRPVHPGVATAVVPPCDDNATAGSSATGVVHPGEETSIEIALAVVTIDNVRDHTDAWLQMQRTTECADGTRLRPVLRFEGDLHDGMRVALPRGRWDAWLRRPGSSPLTGSVRFSASNADADMVVRLP